MSVNANVKVVVVAGGRKTTNTWSWMEREPAFRLTCVGTRAAG